jgi:DNA-binding SARP family transcriptional activator
MKGSRSSGDDHALAPAVTQLRVLTRFELQCDGQVVDVPFVAQRVLAFLAVLGPWERRGTVANALWPDVTEARAAANLRTVVWKLGQLPRTLVHVTRSHIELAADVETDVSALVAQARRLIKHKELCEGDTDARPLACDLLVSWDEEWLTYERERLRKLRLHALEALARRLSTAGRHGEAIEAALVAVSSEPLRESSQQALIAAHLAEGNVSEAVNQYESYRCMLWAELGVEPTETLRALVPTLGLARYDRPSSVAC